MHPKTILLVDDNPDDVALAKRALRKSKVSTKLIVAGDGVEALDFLFGQGKYADRRAQDLPEVILLDIKMPRMDGLELLQHLRSDPRTRYKPVVVLTTSSEEEDRLESYKLGANSYIRKPVDFNQFVEAVESLSHYWLVLNETPQQQA